MDSFIFYPNVSVSLSSRESHYPLCDCEIFHWSGVSSSLEVTLDSAARSLSLWHETTVPFCLEMSRFSECLLYGSISPQRPTVSQTPPDMPLRGCRHRRWDLDYISHLLSDCRRRNRSISVWSDWRSSDVINHTCRPVFSTWSLQVLSDSNFLTSTWDAAAVQLLSFELMIAELFHSV